MEEGLVITHWLVNTPTTPSLYKTESENTSSLIYPKCKLLTKSSQGQMIVTHLTKIQQITQG